MWPKSGYSAVLPPFIHKQPGRPKKVTRKELDEPSNPYKVGKANSSMRCSNCGQGGHNKRSCKQGMRSTKKANGQGKGQAQ